MGGLTCPHCGAPAMRWWRKFFIPPDRITLCTNCHKRISISGRGMAVITLMAIPLIGILFSLDPGPLKMAVLAVGLTVIAVLYITKVPLLPGE